MISRWIACTQRTLSGAHQGAGEPGLDISRKVDMLRPMIATHEVSAARVARLCHALSDETRVEIVRLLGSGERCVCELTDALDAAQSRLSFHLRVLKDAGLISDRRAGRWVHYSLNREALEEAGKFLGSIKPKRRLKVECWDRTQFPV